MSITIVFWLSIHIKRVVYAFFVYNEYMISYMSPKFWNWWCHLMTVQSIQLDYTQCFLVMHSHLIWVILCHIWYIHSLGIKKIMKNEKKGITQKQIEISKKIKKMCFEIIICKIYGSNFSLLTQTVARVHTYIVQVLYFHKKVIQLSFYIAFGMETV